LSSSISLDVTAAQAALAQQFRTVRGATAALAARLSAEDQMVQSCAEASPVKWHLAHTTWFFETFVLREFLGDYRPSHPEFLWLFNSYYKTLGKHPEKKLRASFSRPSLEVVAAYRQEVEQAVLRLLENGASEAAQARIELGMHHEQQHQELIATDIKHAFWTNPLQPAYAPAAENVDSRDRCAAGRMVFEPYPGGLVPIGHTGLGFSFDNELGRHDVQLVPYQLGRRLVTCAEYLEFIEDGGYARPELWLSDGWDTIQAEQWRAPLYWQQEDDGGWQMFTLRGIVPLEVMLQTPVCHVSYYEADAYARWAGFRLPTEFEWEHAASGLPVEGNFVESGRLHPACAAAPARGEQPQQMFGDVWEWTQSAYTAYPGYRPAGGALGEYNGKFMCSQMVLRGGSAVTPQTHMRASYRNFFTPGTRWQFSGIRLAADEDRA
jgi:ergothioneine biosynthesis protein EgtB